MSIFAIASEIIFEWMRLMKASIIIPSYNACERLYYNLMSLNIQHCARNIFEVIVIDNASEDDTYEMLRCFNAAFQLKIIKLEYNAGRAHARNKGLENAEGEIIIFHDSDMIAEPEYVDKHIAAHTDNNMVICGDNWSRIYSFYYKAFKGYLQKGIEEQMPQINKAELHDKCSFIAKEEIINGKCFEKSHKLNKYYLAEKIILEKYGQSLEGYSFPWSMMITNNCSIKKENIINVGSFDESFINWGYEDIDLGYRLYRLGCKFRKREDIRSIHQEHPVDFSDNGWSNLYFLCKKYQAIDLILFYYGYMIPVNKYQANEIVIGIFELQKNNSYKWFVELYRSLLVLLMNINNKKLNTTQKLMDQIIVIKEDVKVSKIKIKDMVDILEGEDLFIPVVYTFIVLLKKVLKIETYSFFEKNTGNKYTFFT